MKDETLQKMVGLIRSWRAEMKNPAVPQKPNADLLGKALKDLDKAGLPEGLASYLILISEYLFRLKVVDEADIYKLLVDIESRLSSIMGHRAVYHLVKALEPSIRKSAIEEGRRPIVFETNLPGAFTDYGETKVNLPLEQQPLVERIKLEPLAPKRSGPLPWIAPWVAGSSIYELLNQKGVQGFNLAFNLVVALHGKPSVEEGDFRKRDKSLKGEELREFITNYEAEYDGHLYNESLEVRKEPLTWEDLIFLQWEPDKHVPGHTSVIYLHSPEMVYGFFNRYNTKGKSSSKKRIRKRGKK